MHKQCAPGTPSDFSSVWERGYLLGEYYRCQSALLLPDVYYDSFHDKALHIIQIHDDCLDFRSMVTSNWLRSQFSSLLNHHMAYHCCVKKYSPVLPWWCPCPCCQCVPGQGVKSVRHICMIACRDEVSVLKTLTSIKIIRVLSCS